jgi:hypothetical protein
MLDWLRRDILPAWAVTACLENVEVLREDDFVAAPPSSRRSELETVH